MDTLLSFLGCLVGTAGSRTLLSCARAAGGLVGAAGAWPNPTFSLPAPHCGVPAGHPVPAPCLPTAVATLVRPSSASPCAALQIALTEGLRTPQQLGAAAERVVRQATEALLEVELTEEAAMECLRQAVPGILR